MTTLTKLTQYGTKFQTQVISRLLTQKKYLINISDSLESEYFENTTHQWIVDKILDYFNKYHTTPTIEILSAEVKKIDNEVLRIAITESLREAYKIADENPSLDWVEDEFELFCTNQKVKKAIMESVDLLNVGDYDGIRSIINDALKAGQDKNIGHIYEKDIESRYREDDRNPIPFPWKTFNDLTQGGYGKGDLVLVFGNPKGGKSWAVASMGAHAIKLGYNVLHYSLELSEGYMGKRYDAILTGIPVDKLDDHKEKIKSIVENIPGKVIIKAYPPRRASFDTIRTHIEQLKTQHDFVPDLIIIDYLDYVRTKPKKERKHEIDDVYVEAKALAGELEIPVVSPSQANRTGASEGILEGKHAAGSYDKIMIADILISLARGRKDRISGTGRWHIMGNRYGADGLTFGSKIDTSTGYIEIYETPLDDEDEEETKHSRKDSKSTQNQFTDLNNDDKDLLKSKFFSLEKAV